MNNIKTWSPISIFGWKINAPFLLLCKFKYILRLTALWSHDNIGFCWTSYFSSWMSALISLETFRLPFKNSLFLIKRQNNFALVSESHGIWWSNDFCMQILHPEWELHHPFEWIKSSFISSANYCRLYRFISTMCSNGKKNINNNELNSNAVEFFLLI